jgi:hypothetical protein
MDYWCTAGPAANFELGLVLMSAGAARAGRAANFELGLRLRR